MNTHPSTTSRRTFVRASALGLAAGASLSGHAVSTAAAQGTVPSLDFQEVPAGKASMVTSADGTKISVNEYGNPAGKPVLLVHGFTQSRLSWTKQFTDPALTANLRIVTMDLRGHGESDKPAGTYTIRNQADDVQAVISTLGLVKPMVVGWSLGGVVVLDYLAVHGLGNVSRLMFVDAGYGRSSDTAAPNTSGSGLLANMPLMLSNDAAVNARGTLNFLKACTYAPLPASDLAFALSFNMLASPASRRSTIAGRRGTPEDYDRNIMPAIKSAGIPVVAATGAQDNIVLPFTAAYIARCTGGSLVSYPNAGHMPFWEDAASFNRDLAAFAAA